MLYISLGLSAVLLVVVSIVALRGGKRGVGWAALLSVAGIIIPFSPVPLNALLVALVGWLCWWLGARPRWFLASAVGVTVLAYGYVACTSALPSVEQWQQLKATYPMESLAGRLAYEGRPRHAVTGKAHDAGRLSEFEERLEDAEKSYDTYRRTHALAHLHAGVVKQFVDSPGFGVMRMFDNPEPYHLEFTEPRAQEPDDLAKPVPQPSLSYSSSLPALSEVKVAESDFAGAQDANQLAFLNPIDFGYLRDRDHVAGFRPHQFRRQPDAPKRWQVERLELVGVLKYDEPVVYLSDYLPKMDELRDAPTRPLDAFEQAALSALRGGEDLMVQDESDRMRMLGSLRAAKQCLRCHDVERGELLGAFSYRLVREAARD